MNMYSTNTGNNKQETMNQKHRTSIMRKVVNSLWAVLNMIFASNFSVIEIDGKSGGFEDENTYNIRIGIGTTSSDEISLSGTDEFNEVRKVTNEIIKEKYNTNPMELFNGPQNAIIGVPKAVLDLIDISCEKYENVPYVLLNDIVLGEDKEWHLQATGEVPKDLKGYCIELKITRDQLKEMKQFSDERVFNYLSFYLFTWLCSNPHFSFNENKFRKRIDTLLGGENNEIVSVEKETQTNEITGNNL